VLDHAARHLPRVVAARGAQIAQPVEAVNVIEPVFRRALGFPEFAADFNRVALERERAVA
jgi:hypothetical protein